MSEREQKRCPKCGSDEVWTYIHVSAYAWVNCNTLVCEEPEDAECCWSDLDDAEDYVCYGCQYEWEEER